MSNLPNVVAGLLDADGITIRLESKIATPPGKVTVTVTEASQAPDTQPTVPADLLTPSGEPKPRYAAYLRYQDEYSKAKQEYDSAEAAAFADPQRAANWPIEGVQLQSAVDSAFSRWLALGHKNEIESRLASMQ